MCVFLPKRQGKEEYFGEGGTAWRGLSRRFVTFFPHHRLDPDPRRSSVVRTAYSVILLSCFSVSAAY